MRGRLALFAILIFVILVSPVLASSEVKTYRDSEYITQSDVFTDGATVYLLASNQVTCCNPIKAKILVNDIEKLEIELADKSDGFFKGSFKISSTVQSGQVQMAHGETAKIEVEFSPIYKRSSDTTAFYLKPDATILAVDLAERAELSWKKVESEISLAHYSIYRSTGELTDSNKQLADTFTTTQIEYEDSTIRPGKTYCYGVSAVDIAGNIASLSNVECIDTADTTAPSSVTGLAASPVQGGRIRLIWTASEDNVAVKEYYVYRIKEPSDDVDGYFPKVSVETSYTDEGLKDSEEYYYKVAAVDTSENIGLASAVASAVADDTPPEETELTAEIQSGGKIFLAWSNVSGAGSYNLYTAPTKGMEATPVVLSAETRTFTHFPEVITFYAVAAVDPAGNEAPLSNIMSMTPDKEAPEPVSGLAIIANPDLSITLTWSKSSDKDFKQYNVYRSTSINFDFSIPYKITSLNSFSDSELAHNQKYYYIVRAADEAGNEDSNTNTVSATARDLTINLEIVSPEKDLKVSQDQLVVAGITDPDATILITGSEEKVIIDETGGFLTIVPLKTGEQEIIVKATDPVGNEQTEIIKVNNKKDEISADAEELRKRALAKVEELSSKTPDGKIEQINVEKSIAYLEEVDPTVDAKQLSKITGLVTVASGGIWSAIIGFIVLVGIIGALYAKKKGRLNFDFKELFWKIRAKLSFRQ